MLKIPNHPLTSFYSLRNRKGDFTTKVVFTLILALVAGYVVLNFVLTTTAQEIKSPANKEKYDKSSKWILGKVTKLGYFPVPNLSAFQVQTRVGSIWVGSKRSYPPVGSRLLMESHVFTTPQSYWNRFADDKYKNNEKKWTRLLKAKGLKCYLGDSTKAKFDSKGRRIQAQIEGVPFPVLYEGTRVRLPF